MSLEAIEKVFQTEQENEERKTAAKQQAKDLIAAAQEAGHAQFDRACAQADAEAKEQMHQAEQRAQQRITVIRQEADEQAQALCAAAQKRLQGAVERIMEGVVR